MTPYQGILPLLATRKCRKCHTDFNVGMIRCPICDKERQRIWRSKNQVRIKERAKRRIYKGRVSKPRISQVEALAYYLKNPNKCLTCSESIVPNDGQPLRFVKVKKFCDRKCSDQFSRNKKPRLSKMCIECGESFVPERGSGKKTCGDVCTRQRKTRNTSKETLLRRGFTDPEKCRENRQKQLRTEEGIAEDLRGEGWEIFSPTVVCDRIGIKDGKVYFLEFKPLKDQRLRPGQRSIADLVPQMYQIIAR